MSRESNEDFPSRQAVPDHAAVVADPALLVRVAAIDPAAVINPAVVAEAAGVRIREELEQVLLVRDPRRPLQRLLDRGIFTVWLPELAATRDLRQQSDRRHKDVWEHTKQVVAQSAERAAVRWAALLHDIGKVPTRRFEPDGRVVFHGHAAVGAALFRGQIAPRLGFATGAAVAIERLIRYHLRAAHYDERWQDRAVRRLYRALGDQLPDLLDLSRADVTSRRPGRRDEALRLIEALAARVRALQAEDARVQPLPSGLGHHLMAHFGLGPGPQVGALIGRLTQAISAGALEPHREPAYYLSYLEHTS